MIEGSGSIPLTFGSGSRRPKKHVDPEDPDPDSDPDPPLLFDRLLKRSMPIKRACFDRFDWEH
jgi:hypothetical protein